jgi:hypothetical protein
MEGVGNTPDALDGFGEHYLQYARHAAKYTL